MRRLKLVLFALLLASPLAAPAQEWRRAPEYDVLLTSYDIMPEVIRLQAGQPVRLRFVNNSNQTHDFSAKRFFAKAKMRRRDGSALQDGRISVGPGQDRTIALVPVRGRYKVRSGNLFRRVMGMKGTIIVE